MTSPSKTHYECCHEAGHAVLRFLRGDTLLSLQVHIDPDGDDAKPRLGARGTTDSRAKERECPCGGYVRNVAPKIDDTNTRSTISVGSQCRECKDNVVTHLASIYAGSRATRSLVPIWHNERDSQFDDDAIEDLFRQMPFDSASRRSLINRAKAMAINIVVRERAAIRALAHELEAAGGSLTGAKASEIIRATW